MSAKETAEAILIVIKRIAKWIAFLILGLCLIWGCVAVYMSVANYFGYERFKKKVDLIVRFDKKQCSDPNFPLFVLIGNQSDKKILKVNFDIFVTKKGYSSKLNNYQSYDSDKIIKKNEGFSSCYTVKADGYDGTSLNGEDMDVKVTDYTVTFE
jgi:hypothetical protein